MKTSKHPFKFIITILMFAFGLITGASAVEPQKPAVTTPASMPAIAPMLILDKDVTFVDSMSANVMVYAGVMDEKTAFNQINTQTGRSYIRATPEQCKLLDKNHGSQIAAKLVEIEKIRGDYMKIYIVSAPVKVASTQ